MKNRSEKKRLDGNSFLLAVTIILFFVMYIAGIIMFGGRGFAKVQNFLNLFISNAGLIVVATGMTIVMITGGIDISVGSVVAMVCMMLAWMMERGNIGAFPAILIAVSYTHLPGNGVYNGRKAEIAWSRTLFWKCGESTRISPV